MEYRSWRQLHSSSYLTSRRHHRRRHSCGTGAHLPLQHLQQLLSHCLGLGCSHGRHGGIAVGPRLCLALGRNDRLLLHLLRYNGLLGLLLGLLLGWLLELLLGSTARLDDALH